MWMGSRVQSRKAVCKLCGMEFASRGLFNHFRKCRKQASQAINTAQLKAEYRANMHARKQLSSRTRLLTYSEGLVVASPEVSKDLGSNSEPHPHHSAQPVLEAATSSVPPPRDIPLPREADASTPGLVTPPTRAVPDTAPDLETPATPIQRTAQHVSPMASAVRAGPEDSSSCLHSSAHATSSDPDVSDAPQPIRPGATDVERPDATSSFEADSIKVEYHPSSGRPTRVYRFEEFNRHRATEPPPAPAAKPWNPFNTRTDFEFAELALDAGLSNEHLDALIKMIRHIVQNANDFTLNSHVDVRQTWDAAANKVTPVSEM